MNTLFAKLNFTTQDALVVLNAPSTFDKELATLDNVRIDRSLAADTQVRFAIAFAVTQEELDAAARALISATAGDAILWFAYPKGSSRRYRCEFNRDSGWQVLGDAGFEGVRQVSLDEDWSALRFRRVEFIKSLKRAPSRALSPAGRSRTTPPREAP